MKPRTLEQLVEELVPHAEDCLLHQNIVALVLAHNADLRAELEGLTQRQAWIDQVGPPEHPDDERQWVLAYLAAKQQLAALHAEVEGLKQECTRQNMVVQGRQLEIHDLTAQLAAMTQERDGLLAVKWTQQTDTHSRLCIAQQQIARLQEALKAIDIRAKLGVAVFQIGDERKDGWWMTDVTYEQLLGNLDSIAELAQHALTPPAASTQCSVGVPHPSHDWCKGIPFPPAAAQKETP